MLTLAAFTDNQVRDDDLLIGLVIPERIRHNMTSLPWGDYPITMTSEAMRNGGPYPAEWFRIDNDLRQSCTTPAEFQVNDQLALTIESRRDDNMFVVASFMGVAER